MKFQLTWRGERGSESRREMGWKSPAKKWWGNSGRKGKQLEARNLQGKSHEDVLGKTLFTFFGGGMDK